MENTSKVKNWKQCPNCKGYIPQSWQQHKKCGWNVKEQPQKGFKIESMPTTPEPEHTLTEDEFILDNIYKSWDIATKFYDKTKADNKAMTTLLVEVMRERHSFYISARIELQKLTHMQMIRDEKEAKK